jgi:hypothetical protein
MQDNNNDRTIERNFLQKWRVLIPEYGGDRAIMTRRNSESLVNIAHFPIPIFFAFAERFFAFLKMNKASPYRTAFDSTRMSVARYKKCP